jgi:hypothetical protein
VTYKASTTGDVPVINGFIEGLLTTKQAREVRDTTDIPFIHGSTEIIVDANAKCETA